MAQQLRDTGIAAAALTGGLDAWRALFPVEPVPEAESARYRREQR